jgi:hypothetical protein
MMKPKMPVPADTEPLLGGKGSLPPRFEEPLAEPMVGGKGSLPPRFEEPRRAAADEIPMTGTGSALPFPDE